MEKSWIFTMYQDQFVLGTYLEENGLHAYGGVITGPTKEFLKLKEDHNIRMIRLGEVRLWDW